MMNETKTVTTAWMVAACAGGLVALSVSMTGCAKGAQRAAIAPPKSAVDQPAAWTYTGRPVSEPLVNAFPQIAASDGPKLIGDETITNAEAALRTGEDISPTAVKREPGELIKVKYTAAAAPISDVLQVLVGQMMKRPYVLDPKLAGGTISLDIDEEMTKAELGDFVGALASLYDWAIEDREGVLMFKAGVGRAKIATGPVLSGVTPVDSELNAVRVRKLRYASPTEMVGVVKELMTEGSKQFAVGRMIVMADTTRQLNRMSRLIAAMDTPSFEGVSVWTYRLGTRTPEDAAKVLETIAQTSRINPTGAAEPLAAFVPISGSDRLMVISRDPSLRSLVRTFVEQVDQPPEKSRRERYIYRVQNFEPVALQNFVTNAMSDKVESAGAAPGSAGAVGGLKKPVRMVLEQNERLLMIEASPADYAEVLSLIKAIDRPKMQVFINSTIAEVALTGNLEFGVQYFFQGDAVEKLGIFGLTGSPGTLPVLPGGGSPTGSVFFTGSDGLALVQAIQREAKVEILSQPRIYVADGFKATIDVGGETPIASSSAETPAQDQGNTLSRTDIQYKSTGVKLEIKPKLNESGLIGLEITQENRVLTTSGDTSVAGRTSPAFQTRRVVTNVTVPSGRTVVLGGFIDDQKSKGVSKVPVLGDLPLIGEAFRTTAESRRRTELLLTITPTIIPEPSETVTQMSDFLRAAEGVRAVFASALDELPRGMLGSPELPFFKPEVVPAEGEEAPAAEPVQEKQ
jgi:general secretion pathway protein D